MAQAAGKNPSRGGEEFASQSAGREEIYLRTAIIGGLFAGTPDHQDRHLRHPGCQLGHKGGTGDPRQAQTDDHQGKSLLEVGFIHANECRAGVSNTLYAGELGFEGGATEMGLKGIVNDEKDGCPVTRFGGRRR